MCVVLLRQMPSTSHPQVLQDHDVPESGWGWGFHRDGLRPAEARIGAPRVQEGPHSALLQWPAPFCLQTSTKGGVFASLCIKWREEASRGFFRAREGMLRAWTAHQVTGRHCVREVRQAG